MKPSRGCLSPWQIDLAEVLSSQKLNTTTAELLSRLESFMHAYLLFDSIFIPEKYRASQFLHTLDVEGDIFAADSRVADPYKQSENGHTHVDIAPSLMFKNRRHLKAKSNAWLKQHMTIGLSKQGREEAIEYLNREGRSTAWFYQLILAEYQTLFELATFNEAFSVVFASLSQVYLPDITELPRFSAFLAKLSKAGAPARRSDFVGTYSFELPTGAIEARAKIPPIFDTVVKHANREGFTAALRHLRQQYQPLREAFRTVTDAFVNYQGNGLVSSDMEGREIQEWNDYVERHYERAEELLLLKSEVVAVEVHAGKDSEIFQTLRDRVVARGSLLRLVPPQSHVAHSRNPNGLGAFGIENVIPFQHKLFRIGRNYVNKRRALHKGIGLMIGFPLSVGVQVAHEGLNDPKIRMFDEEKPPHLYMICTRPRISVNPDIRLYRDRIEIEFRFVQETHVESGVVSLARNNVRNVTVDAITHARIVFEGDNAEQSRWHASLLYQSLVKSIAPENNAALVLDPERAGLSEKEVSDLARADLEVIYIGQSKGRDFDRTAISRLNGHEKWETFYRDIADRNPHREIWILLLSQSAPQHLNMTMPGVEGGDNDVKELIRRTKRPVQLNPLDCLNFTEAALISYFRPRYNDKFRKAHFPSKKHESYERFFLEPVDVASIELETLRSMGFRLYSESVCPRAVHLKMWRFNSAFDVWNIFSGVDDRNQE